MGRLRPATLLFFRGVACSIVMLEILWRRAGDAQNIRKKVILERADVLIGVHPSVFLSKSRCYLTHFLDTAKTNITPFDKPDFARVVTSWGKSIFPGGSICPNSLTPVAVLRF